MKNKIKEFLRKLPFYEVMVNIIKGFKLKKEFKNDYKFFKSNYIYSKTTVEKIEYDMLLRVHALEKGMSSKEPRPFGREKVTKLIYLIKKYDKLNNNKSFAYNMSLNALKAYMNFYEEKNWQNHEEYQIVSEFMNANKNFEVINAGSHIIKKQDFVKNAKIDYNEFLASRHSVRNFSSKSLNEKDIRDAVKMAIKSPSACNRQMCKIYYIKSDKNKQTIIQYAQGLSNFDLTNINFFVITFDVSANYFVGERNQGWFNAGLIAMNFVNALHSLEIGSCFIQFGNSFKQETELKKILKISKNERIAVIIAAGYYDEESQIPYSSRKDIKDIYIER